MKKLKRGEPGHSVVRQQILTKSNWGCGFPAKDGDYIMVDYDHTKGFVTVEVSRGRKRR